VGPAEQTKEIDNAIVRVVQNRRSKDRYMFSLIRIVAGL
jgi:hypothetical protein